jgi:hypothetical protein
MESIDLPRWIDESHRNSEREKCISNNNDKLMTGRVRDKDVTRKTPWIDREWMATDKSLAFLINAERDKWRGWGDVENLRKNIIPGTTRHQQLNPRNLEFTALHGNIDGKLECVRDIYWKQIESNTYRHRQRYGCRYEKATWDHCQTFHVCKQDHHGFTFISAMLRSFVPKLPYIFHAHEGSRKRDRALYNVINR